MQTLLALAGVVIGGLIATLMPHLLASRTAQRQELREVRIALLDTRDLVWEGERSVQNHIAKLRVRAVSLGIDRELFTPLLEAHKEVVKSTIYNEDGEFPEFEVGSMIVTGPALGKMDRALEALELSLSSHRVRWRR